MTKLDRYYGSAHLLISTSPGMGHYLPSKRTCTRCKEKKTQKGGTTRNGSCFVCADCRPKVVS